MLAFLCASKCGAALHSTRVAIDIADFPVTMHYGYSIYGPHIYAASPEYYQKPRGVRLDDFAVSPLFQVIISSFQPSPFLEKFRSSIYTYGASRVGL